MSKKGRANMLARAVVKGLDNFLSKAENRSPWLILFTDFEHIFSYQPSVFNDCMIRPLEKLKNVMLLIKTNFFWILRFLLLEPVRPGCLQGPSRSPMGLF